MKTLSRIGVAACAATLLSSAAGAPAAAQIRGSEAGTVSQTLDGTTIAMAYSRPSARGRDLFGALVPWDVVWTPGANWATTFETDRDVRLNGIDVPAGKYSVWMIPHEAARIRACCSGVRLSSSRRRCPWSRPPIFP